jgi:D-inositol-3-phosphate glycosyltransferase
MLTRRLAATRQVWRAGGAHMAMLTPPVPAPVPPAPVPLPSGHIDAPAPGSVLPREPVTLRGWALFESGPPSRVELWIGDVALGPARLGGHRPDVQRLYGLDGLIAEWEHIVDLGELDELSGEVTVRAVAIGADGERQALAPVVAFVAPALAPPKPAPPRVQQLASRRGDGPRVVAFTHRLDLGGAQLILQDLLLELRGSGAIDCVVVSPFDGELRAPLERAGIAVHVAGPIPVEDPVVYAARVEELALWVADGGFDVALVNTSLAFAGADAAARAGLPALWAIHESYTPATLWRVAYPGMHPDVRLRADAVLARADAAIFEAEATRRLYAPHVGGTCLTRPYGLDLAALEAARAGFDVARARQERGVPLDARVVLAVGTVEPRKAQVPLVQAFGRVARRHPDALLVVIGAWEGTYSRALREYAGECDWADRVRVLPVIADTWPWYGLADLMVCASDLESLPRSVLEAMWWETPVLATSVFGLPEAIEHGRTGWLCEPRDVDALAGALDVALAAPVPERRAIAQAGRALVQERHDLERYAVECGELLRGIALARTAPRAGRGAVAGEAR